MSQPYTHPVDRLLTLGEASGRTLDVPNFEGLGLGHEHVGELVRMATDPELNYADSESAEVWAPTHAWRALAHLRAAEAAEPLTRFLAGLKDDDDWAFDELPEILARIGPPALPHLAALLNDPAAISWNRIAAARAAREMVEHHPEVRDEVVALLTDVVARSAEHPGDLTSHAVGDLCTLEAAESAPVIEKAFQAGHVNRAIVGDWEDVQIELGLLSTRITPRRSLLPDLLPDFPRMGPDDGLPSTPARTAAQHAKAKAKKKAERKARKKNRRR
jgi:hypothetical protein